MFGGRGNLSPRPCCDAMSLVRVRYLCVCVWRNWRIVNELWFHNGHSKRAEHIPNWTPTPNPLPAPSSPAKGAVRCCQSCALYQLLQFVGVAPRGVLRLRLTLQLVCCRAQERKKERKNPKPKTQNQCGREAEKAAKIDTTRHTTVNAAQRMRYTLWNFARSKTRL